ncbi:LOW QUALITY PROTEIN: hypothetical protein RJ639_011375, partial [Escallonia herrerae]
MSSDLFVFDNSFFNDPFSAFTDSPLDNDILQEISDSFSNPVDETTSLGQIPLPSSLLPLQVTNWETSLFAKQPICQMLQALPVDFSALEVKTEECQVPIYSSSYDYSQGNSFLPHSYSGSENAVKMMQRSFSSNCFDGKPNFPFQPRFDSLMESPNFQTQISTSSESSFSSGSMRRACSTGDLQNMKTAQTSHRLSSSPLAMESSFMEEASSKVGRYSAEERKERIHRYRAKRNQRNFNKTIKYACRKTLADNRPRIRGRFARNDEPGEIPKAATFNRYEDEDDL